MPNGFSTALLLGALAGALFAGAGEAALAADCPGHPDAIGTSRILTLGPAEHPRIGTLNYPESLDLADREVVLTFDDGPLGAHTKSVLDTLASECVKATFFVVGAMAAHAPDIVRRAYDEGHTVGTHTQSHPHLPKLAPAKAESEIERGIAAAQAALGPSRPLAPFFRAPYLQMTPALESFAASRGLAVWSVDVHAADWDKVAPAVVLARALDRLEHRRKGILLLHDIQARTAQALPALLHQLKARGFRIVHVVPRSAAGKGRSGEQAVSAQRRGP